MKVWWALINNIEKGGFMNRKTKAAEFVDDVYNITVTGRNLPITEAIRDHVIDKLSKIERFSHRIIDVAVTLEVQKLDHRVDIVMRVDHTKIASHATTENLYTTIDLSVDKLEAQLLRYKDKIQDHHARGIKAIEMDVNVISPHRNGEILDVNDEIEEENRRRLVDKYTPHQIVNKEKRSLKTLTDGEALMKLELSSDPFIIYKCEESHVIKVMHRRKDGNFSVIEPKA